MATDNCITISLTQGQSAIIDECDIDLKEIKWFASFKSTYSGDGKYVAANRNVKDGKKLCLYLHRVILSRILNRELTSQEICDHINGDPLDNRRHNLRIATRGQNQYNQKRRSDNTSGFKGVSFSAQHKKWQAYIWANKKGKFLGYFDTPEEAREAYAKASAKYHGEFGRTE